VVINSCFIFCLNHSHTASTDAIAPALRIVIRTAQSDELHSLAEILTNSFHPPQGLMYWISPILKLGIYEDLRHRLRSSSSHYICLVATQSDPSSDNESEDVVGTVEVSLRSTYSWSSMGYRHPYISNLAVKNSCRRKGIARKLLNMCEKIALEWGFKEISLHVLENNYQGKRLYFSSGYELHQVESSLSGWLLQHPKRLLLSKRLH
jgi:ribosomal protein S18 acetylase RimI-like enzyme